MRLCALVLVWGMLLGTKTTLATPDEAAKKLGQAFRALRAGKMETARSLSASIDAKQIVNDDYLYYVRAQAEFYSENYAAALRWFRSLENSNRSRFQAAASWRIADCLWHQGKSEAAATKYLQLLESYEPRQKVADPVVAKFRIAEAQGNTKAAIQQYRALVRGHPAHPLASQAISRLLTRKVKVPITNSDRLTRARSLQRAHRWHEAISELEQIENGPKSRNNERDFLIGMTLFKMRRDYKRAGDILLRIYPKMGARAPKALFHGARALSRADFDDDAIRWYQKLVTLYPNSSWAPEAQFLSGWLKYNMGKYKAGLPHLNKMIKTYPRSRWAKEAEWFLAFSHYLLGNHKSALRGFAKIAKRGGKLSGHKGRYWHARTQQQLGNEKQAVAEYQAMIGRYPLSWYELLAMAQLKKVEFVAKPFSPHRKATSTILADAANPPKSDFLITIVDELAAAGLKREAGIELRRGEKSFLKRHPKPIALAVLMNRYQQFENFNRPWMLGVVHGKSALNSPPTGPAKQWWHYAYPSAYTALIKKWQHLGKAPVLYILSIMRKESGYNPHTRSYADALGLLQMIPPTTKKVVKALGLTYSEDFLFEPELNIRVGSWYIGKLLAKFANQIPIGAGSFNSGPRPVMRWLDAYGKRPTDEFVELVAYRQTREYMKKVTENYARYRYLYDNVTYEQPLTVNANYRKDALTY